MQVEKGLEMTEKHLLATWYRSHAAHAIYAAEMQQLATLLPNYFGYYLVQLNGPTDAKWLHPSPIKHTMRVDESPHNGIVGFSSAVSSDFASLPFAENSIDVFLLPHTLECCAFPFEVLKETVQALMPEGYLIIVGFNPLSLWGIQQLLTGNTSDKFIKIWSIGHIRRWLTTLGCAVDECKTFTSATLPAWFTQLKLPWKKTNLDSGCLFGGLYIIVARKQVIMPTPIRWQPRLLPSIASTKRALYPTQPMHHQRHANSEERNNQTTPDSPPFDYEKKR